MPGLEIIKKSFPTIPFAPGVGLIRVPYIPIYQGGYGRMTKDTPGDGLCTSPVASCTSVVFHCSANGRTVLTHSPNYMYMDTSMGPIIRWIIGDEVMPRIEAVVLRGFMYASPQQAANFNHAGWMNDFRQFLGFCPCRPEIVDSSQMLMSGSVLVDKLTARITIVSNPGQTCIQNSSDVGQDYMLYSSSIDVFIGNFQIVKRMPPDLYLQYDVSKYNPHMPIPNEVRLLLRSKYRGDSKSAQGAVLRSVGMGDWINSPAPQYLSVQTGYSAFDRKPMPCERCNSKGSKRCSSCLGAWYCSSEHQKEDWKVHKVWCKANALKK